MSETDPKYTCGIDEEIIELYAMGRLQDAVARAHLDTCSSCKGRIVECREYVIDLKAALRVFQVRDQDVGPAETEASWS